MDDDPIAYLRAHNQKLAAMQQAAAEQAHIASVVTGIQARMAEIDAIAHEPVKQNKPVVMQEMSTDEWREKIAALSAPTRLAVGPRPAPGMGMSNNVPDHLRFAGQQMQAPRQEQATRSMTSQFEEMMQGSRSEKATRSIPGQFEEFMQEARRPQVTRAASAQFEQEQTQPARHQQATRTMPERQEAPRTRSQSPDNGAGVGWGPKTRREKHAPQDSQAEARSRAASRNESPKPAPLFLASGALPFCTGCYDIPCRCLVNAKPPTTTQQAPRYAEPRFGGEQKPTTPRSNAQRSNTPKSNTPRSNVKFNPKPNLMPSSTDLCMNCHDIPCKCFKFSNTPKNNSKPALCTKCWDIPCACR
eukprot:TRINITY_DN26406_c0_g2_i1.p1 TRINITY_DN26406_c0_g2~~TRINITY_DN26406_c0_g2_i1.p1  ORF type:complete len:359 (-),score=34.87 TRINITY_DN26406_c0_g2_i1:222-1298(-)